MRYFISLSLLAVVACGGGSSGGGTPVDTVAQLTIKNTGITTQTGNPASGVQVPNPGLVMFINSDAAPHNIASSSAGCGSLNSGNLQTGQSSPTITLSNTTSANIVCDFSDTLNPANAALKGQVVILTSGAGTGSGY
jgi:hypothetical protein